jgi:hypothetical protein
METILSERDESWARAYARQALSDLDAREALVEAGTHKCHRLHFLQMASEKVSKAHLTKANGHDNVRKRHDYVAKHLPTIARIFYAAMNDGNEIRSWEIGEIRRLAKEIEVLSPACDGGDLREDNSEYPWEDGRGSICIPCEYSFPRIDDESRAIVRLIRLIRAASESYSR